MYTFVLPVRFRLQFLTPVSKIDNLRFLTSSTHTMNMIPFAPTGFQTVYGNEFLDTLHNFFPEMMYDDTLFGAEWMAWMRSRTAALFPAYVRQQNHYNIYQSEQRRADFNLWRSAYNVNPNYIPRTPNRRTAAAAAAPPPLGRTMRRSDFAAAEPAPAQRRAHRAPEAPYAAAESIFTSLLNQNIPVVSYTATVDDADLLNPMMTLLRAALHVDTGITPPTAEQIAAATTVLAPPVGTECTVCQESSGENDLAWRRINRCNHMFHDTCIQPWLQSHNTCPTCRGQL